ncbi:phosphopentomutase [Clostridium cylindrosporum]|uniref:Phosphopentomutase n=1 Tax=Clostridium cylindrosporum DSM 605 TaxID=1121307 RepID=A0A0J8DAL8_CLOCY|nr:phosphopentomutase [Clostridium cylindrosporum]KMT21364.1 phosphopentomutase DeoB [Clostridium cylindrosporum DSM 605]
MVMNRVILIVLDSVGIGEMPDAHIYGDDGSNTIGNISKSQGGISLNKLASLGFSNIDGIEGLSKVENPLGSYGRLMEKSKGKDTTTGHFEIAGIIVEKEFPTYPNGFPREVIEEFEEKTGLKVIGNRVASGTEIVEELGEEHVKTGNPICYTSADSVFQIAAHEDIIPIDRLYEICVIARKILVGEHGVGRVIARPFIGTKGNFKRTSNRRDFSLKPPKKTMLDYIKNSNMDVQAVGKIEDIYAGEGITDAVHISDNMDGVNKTLEYIKSDSKGLIFTNLVDFDMHYGHRNNPIGYKKALEEFDNRLQEIIDAMKKEDVLIITADHGCDPTTPSTDHSREYTPLVIYGENIKQGVNLGTRDSFSDIGKTVLDILNIENDIDGISFKKEILKESI